MQTTARTLLADAMLLALAAAVHWAAFAAILSVFALAAMALAWRERPTWGKRRGWPPGTVGFGPDSVADPDHFMRSLRRYGPVFKSNFGSEPMICIADLGLAQRLYREHESKLTQIPAPFNRFVPSSMLRWSAGAERTERRSAFLHALSLRLVRSCEPIMATIVQTEVARMVRACSDSGRAVAPRDPLREIVLASWSQVLFGIAGDTAEFQEVRTIFADLDVYQPRVRTDEAILARLTRLQQLICSAAAQAGQSMAAEYARLSPDALTDLSTIRNLIFTAITTREDVAGLLLWLFKLLGDNPAWIERLRTAPEDGTDLSDRIVSETLRLAQSEYVLSRAKNEIQLDEFVIPAQWMIRVCVREAHRDPRKFDNPNGFNPDRFLTNRYGRDAFSPFGLGNRSCTGEILARAMARVFITELVHRFEWRVISDGPSELSSHRHWAPSGQLAVAISHRAHLPVGT